MPAFQEFAAWIEIEGIKTKEFAQEIALDPQHVPIVACWISSEIGKSFTIHLSDSARSAPVECSVRVDGVSTGGRVLHRGKTRVVHSGLRVSPETVKPYVFAPVELTDNDEYLDSYIPQALGQIEVKLTRVDVTGRTTFTTPREPPEDLILHERAKKAIIQQVGFGQPVQTMPSDVLNIQKLDIIAKFVFKYRSRDQLMALNVIPCPTPVASPSKRKRADQDPKLELLEDDDILDDASETQAIRDLEAKLDQMKRRQAQKRSPKKVKREPIVREFVDLTL
ncbi:hypothetical protein C8J56DRAFT_928941 [Mycena floridula]|nr:hypothetical protein C8J56DRAFT_928941 [Mycena floridula]